MFILLRIFLLFLAFQSSVCRISCPQNCTLFGTCNEELGRCDCPRIRQGLDCSLSRTDYQKICKRLLFRDLKECKEGKQSCVNKCNKKGKCILGFCHCDPGFFGSDCALSIDKSNKTVLLRGMNYSTRRKRPWVYVYDLPPEFTTWQNLRTYDRPLHIVFLQRLLSSGARVTDPSQADWFFIPMRLRRPSDAYPFMAALRYVKRTWPWWNKYQGHRHFFIHTGDIGRMDGSETMRQATENCTWLTHWGLFKNNRYSGWRSSHRIGKDVVIPIYMSNPHINRLGIRDSGIHPRAPPLARTIQLLFAGRICGDYKPPKLGVWPNCAMVSRGYSAGVRQRIHYQYWNRTGYKISNRNPKLNEDMKRAKFCLSPPGGGHGHRQILSTFAGCVPLLMGDNIMQPFEPELNWADFSVSIPISEIGDTHEVLEGMAPERLKKMQAALRCAAMHNFYSTIIGSFVREDGRYDAFETILEVLRVKLAYPDAKPRDFVHLDADFRSFMACGKKHITDDDPKEVALPALCSLNAHDKDLKSCDTCRTYAHETLGYPGGEACCGSSDMAHCVRPWP